MQVDRKAEKLVLDIVLKAAKNHKGDQHDGQAQCHAGHRNAMAHRGKTTFPGLTQSLGNEIREVQDYT